MNYAMDAFAASDAMELSVTSANGMYKLTKGVVEEVVRQFHKCTLLPK